jgi:Transposase DDE domain
LLKTKDKFKPKGIGMSHQDHGRDICATFLREAIEWIVSKDGFARIEFREDCSWKPWTLAATALLWVWSNETTLTERLVAARKITQKAYRLQHDLAGSYQAFLKMLVRWAGALIMVLVGRLRGRMQAKIDFQRVAGCVVLGVDGSRVELPRTASNQAGYSPLSSIGKRRRSRKGRRNKSGRKKAENPQMWITTMWHVGSGLPWDWRTGRSDSSERAHLLEMIGDLPAGSLVTADAGFIGYEYWNALQKASHPLVIRVGKNVKLLKKLGYARERSGLVYLWPDRMAAKSLPPLVLRLIVVAGNRHPVYLVTSILDENKLSDHEVIEIYRLRWGIEVFYRSFKQTFQRRKLRSHKAEHARVELDWSFVGLWAACLYAQQLQDAEPRRLSVAGVLRAFRCMMRNYRNAPDRGEDLVSLLAAAVIDSYRRRSKSSRSYPRKKKERPAGKPKIVTATKIQIQRVRQIKKQEREIRLTA